MFYAMLSSATLHLVVLNARKKTHSQISSHSLSLIPLSNQQSITVPLLSWFILQCSLWEELVILLISISPSVLLLSHPSHPLIMFLLALRLRGRIKKPRKQERLREREQWPSIKILLGKLIYKSVLIKTIKQVSKTHFCLCGFFNDNYLSI